MGENIAVAAKFVNLSGEARSRTPQQPLPERAQKRRPLEWAGGAPRYSPHKYCCGGRQFVPGDTQPNLEVLRLKHSTESPPSGSRPTTAGCEFQTVGGQDGQT